MLPENRHAHPTVPSVRTRRGTSFGVQGLPGPFDRALLNGVGQRRYPESSSLRTRPDSGVPSGNSAQPTCHSNGYGLGPVPRSP